jgi:hypothetical protein
MDFIVVLRDIMIILIETQWHSIINFIIQHYYSGTAHFNHAAYLTFLYIRDVMKQTKTLLTTNKYLRNALMREQMIIRHASTSARIEGVQISLQRIQKLARKSESLRTA